MSVYDLSVTDALLTTTRSVRKRLDLERDVSDDIIRECIDLAVQAPTGSNRQGWHWIVVREAETRKGLADCYRRGAGTYLEDRQREAEASGNEQDLRIFGSARYLADRLEEVPVHVIACITTDHLPADPPAATLAGLMGSIYPAVWSFQLALRARGLGTVLTTLHLQHADAAAQLLGIPPAVLQVALLPVAYTIGTDFKPAKRRPLDEIVHWERW